MQLPLCESYGLMETGSLTWPSGGFQKIWLGRQTGARRHIRIRRRWRDHRRARQHPDQRYFQSAEGENERTFIGPGRIATGDIGKLDEDGYLYLLGPKEGIDHHRRRLQNPSGDGGNRTGRLSRYRPGGSIPEARRAHLDLRGGAQPSAKRGRPRTRCAICPRHENHKGGADRRSAFRRAAFSTQNGMLRPNLKLDRRNIAAKFNLN